MDRDDRKFEYVDFKPELDAESNEKDLLAVKSEVIEFPEDSTETKCGSVFISNGGGYTFVCEFCVNRFANIDEFGTHLQSKHFNVGLGSVASSFEASIVEQSQFKVDKFDENEDDVSDENDEKVSCYSPASNESETDEEDEFEAEEVDIKPKLLQKSTEIGNYYCPLCKRSLKTKKTFARHNRRHQENTLKTAPKLKKEKKPPVTRISCELCTNDFGSMREFREHAERLHANQIPLALQADPAYLQCIFCFQPFFTVPDRLEHEKTHIEERPYRCLFCPRRFCASQHRDMHDGPYYSCPYKMRIEQNSQPIEIARTNTENEATGDAKMVSPPPLPSPLPQKKKKEWPCEYCGKVYTDNRRKRIHVRTHTNEKPYVCEECGSNFRTSKQLNTHKKRHAGIKDYICMCGKLFYTKKGLTDHQAMHSTERPFKCAICGKAFPRKKALQTHEQLHSDFKRYECTFCGKRFAQCAGLHSHRKIHHSDLLSK